MALDHPDGDAASTFALDLVEVEAGLRTLERYLARHAAFDRWCADHVRRYGRAPGEHEGPDAPAPDRPA